jgi:hypothetical protein
MIQTWFACPFCEGAELDFSTSVVRCERCGAVANRDSWNARSVEDFLNVLALRRGQTITTSTTGDCGPIGKLFAPREPKQEGR